jgi:hypothetical protein
MSLSELTTLTASLGFTERNDPFKLFRRMDGGCKEVRAQ